MSAKLKRLFGNIKPVIAMVHFGALPGSPLYDSDKGIAGLLEGVRKDLPIRDWKPRGQGRFSVLNWASAGADLLGFDALGRTLRQIDASVGMVQLDGLLAVWHPAGEK